MNKEKLFKLQMKLDKCPKCRYTDKREKFNDGSKQLGKGPIFFGKDKCPKCGFSGSMMSGSHITNKDLKKAGLIK